jgi:hypothetical protein
MTALMLAQTDSTGQKVTLIVFGLVAVAAALALLTAWYWRKTDPGARDGATRGRGGQRRRIITDPEPSPDPGVDPPTSASSRPAATDGAVSTLDQTRLLNRSEILDRTPDESPSAPPTNQPQPDVIDLRSDTSPGNRDGARSADDATGEMELDDSQQSTSRDRLPDTDSSTLDLDSIDAETPGSAGAHDDGIDFDEWLAMAEEES